jgi:tetratricopeptide (TPR) repeat protein
MSFDIEKIDANINRGRAVLQTATSVMSLFDKSAGVLEQALDVNRDVSSAVQLWRSDGKSNPVVSDSFRRREAEVQVWPTLSKQVENQRSIGTRDWRGVSNIVKGTAQLNPLGLAVTSGITLLNGHLDRRVHKAGYQNLQLALRYGFSGLDQTLGAGLGELSGTLSGEIADQSRVISAGLGELSGTLSGEIADQSRVISAGLGELSGTLRGGVTDLGRVISSGLGELIGTLSEELSTLNEAISGGLLELSQTFSKGFQDLTAEFSWGISELLWRSDQQNATMAEIRDILTRPLDVQSKELRARAIRSYENGWLPEAEADFLQAMEKSRVDYVVAHYLGNIYLIDKRYDDAANWFGKSARYSRPEEPRHSVIALMHQALAYSLRESGQGVENWRLAAGCLDQATELDPTNVELCFQRAHCKAKLGESKAATDALEDAINHDGRYLAKALMEPDFQPLADEIANLTYWLTRSYARTIEAEIRRFAPFLRQVSENITVGRKEKVGTSNLDDAEMAAYLELISYASWLYSQGDLYSVQQAQNLLLALDIPSSWTQRSLPSKSASRSSKSHKASSAGHGYARYGRQTGAFKGVGGDLV